MKIANIIEDARVGGPQIRITQVAKKLKGTEYDTTILLPKADNSRFKQMLENENIKYKELPLHRLTKEKKYLIKFIIFFFYEIYVLYKYLKKERFDIIHVSGGSWQWKGVIAGKLAGCKVIWHLNDTKMPSYIKVIFKTLAKYFTDAFILAGNRVKEYYLDNLNIKKPYEIIPAPVDTNKFNPELDYAKLKEIKDNKINIITIGNINPIKGHHIFIKLANELNKEFDNLNFLIIGNIRKSQIKYFTFLQNLIKKYNIKNLNIIQNINDVRDYLKFSDVYICSSIAEASPTVVWEALSMGKIVFSTDVADVSNYLENRYIGNLYNFKEFVQKILNYLNNNDISKFDCKNRTIAIKNFDISIIVKKHKNVYNRVYKLKFKGEN